jgi:hypothetical protein
MGLRGRAVDNVVTLHQVFDVFFAVARNATILNAISPNATQGQFYLDTARRPPAFVSMCCEGRTFPEAYAMLYATSRRPRQPYSHLAVAVLSTPTTCQPTQAGIHTCA